MLSSFWKSFLIGLVSSVIADISPIEVKGNAFWDSKSGERFYIRGVDYQPGGSGNLTDSLAIESICERDVPIFTDLGLNTIRAYSVDNSLNHDACMKKLADAGIYLILDVNTPKNSISRLRPARSYNAPYLQHVFATIDAFANYDNVLGFFAGNEVINNENTTNTAPYVKAVVRDMKNYIKARSYREIPVGYSAADVSQNRLQAAQYFTCGNDSSAKSDFIGINDYSWCGKSSFLVSGYREKVDMYENIPAPIFLSEFGCNEVPGSRPFTEIGTIYSTQMSSVFSGGLVYEYSEEPNNYGLVNITSEDSVLKQDDFYNLQGEYNSTKNPTGDGGSKATVSSIECPTLSDNWVATDDLPTLPEDAETYMKDGAGKPKGNDGASTQDMGPDDESSSSASPSSSSSGSSSSGSSSSATHSKSKGVAGALRTPFFYEFDTKANGVMLTLMIGGALAGGLFSF